MKKKPTSKAVSAIPDDAVLLIPEPEYEHEPAPYAVKPGYYNSKQMLELIDQHKGNAEAIRFIADMLETGDPENDGFAVMLRTSCRDSHAIGRIVKICRN
jgi:hypothetical protein